MEWLDFVVLILAAGAPVNAWLHEGGVFQWARDLIEPWGLIVPTDAKPSRWELTKEKIAQLLTCRFCLSYHAPIWLLVLFYVPSLFIEDIRLSILVKLPLYALAATRVTYWLTPFDEEEI